MSNSDRKSPDKAKTAQVGLDEEHLFGVHPDGVGQTLGGDLLRPNPGRDLPPEAEDADEA
jgi:hypothetical protein